MEQYFELRKWYTHYVLLLLIVCTPTSQMGWAQFNYSTFPLPHSSNLLLVNSSPADTSQTIDSIQTVTMLPPTEEPSPKRPPVRGYQSTKSPALAVLISAVAPGTGQIYNESYWKAPIIWSLGGYWVYEWLQLNDKYQSYRDQFSRDPPGPNSEQTKRVRDFYRDERDKFAWYLGALYFANLLDAYVGASLYDFNVSPDLGADGIIVPRITVSLRLTF